MSHFESFGGSGAGGGGDGVPNSLNTFYVDKNGSDSNNGKSIANAYLTFGAALTAANAQTPKWGVECQDYGVYAENLNIPSGVSVFAPNATIQGVVTVNGNTTIQALGKIEGPENSTALVIADGNNSIVNVQYITYGGTSTYGVRFQGTTGLAATVNVQKVQLDPDIGFGSGSILLESFGYMTAGFLDGNIQASSGSLYLSCAILSGSILGTESLVNMISADLLDQIQSIEMDDGGYIGTQRSSGNTYTLSAYDVDNTQYRSFVTLTAGNTPSLAISAPSGGTANINNTVIGATTQANAQFYNPINAQTGTTYTLVAADCGKFITLSNASAITLTLPQQSTTTTSAGFWCRVRNIGAGTVTIVKQGAETLTGNTTLITNAECRIERNTTTNWAVFAGTASVNMPGYNTLIQTVANVTYTLVGYAGNAGTILGCYQKARALTTAGTFNIQINGVNVTSLTSIVPSTAGSYTAATGANTFVRGDQITIVFSGTSAVLDQNICIDFTQQF